MALQTIQVDLGAVSWGSSNGNPTTAIATGSYTLGPILSWMDGGLDALVPAGATVVEIKGRASFTGSAMATAYFGGGMFPTAGNTVQLLPGVTEYLTLEGLELDPDYENWRWNSNVLARVQNSTIGASYEMEILELSIVVDIPDPDPDPGPDPDPTPDPGPHGPTLTKYPSIELVSPAVPPKAGIEPRQFWMFAAPPPPGYTYNQGKASDGSLRPDSLATFQNWKPLLQVKKPITIGGGGSGGGSGGWTFISLEELLGGTTGSVSIPGDWTPVYDTDDRLVGYMVPPSSTGAGGSSGSWPKHYGPIAYMSYARFPEYETFANGYPKTDEPRIWGEFDIPTLEGLRTFRFTFVKRGDGQWVRDGGGDPLPPYVVEDRRTTSRIAVLSDFPGAPAVPGRPAEYRTNRHVGWNAGADSVHIHEGDCRVRFYHAVGVAGCVGLTPVRERDVGDFATIEYGFYVDLDAAGATRACVVERGRRTSAYFPCTQDTKFVIARERNLVRYEVDGVVVAESPRLSEGPLMVGSSLFVADDGVY